MLIDRIKNDITFSAVLPNGTEITKDLMFSKSGIPCLTENGGAWSNTGDVDIICNKNYNKKKAIHIFTRGELAMGDHALIPVAVGDHLINVQRHWDICKVTDFVIVNIVDGKAVLRVNRCGATKTDYSGNHAIEAAIAKSLDYHCRTPYYIRN